MKILLVRHAIALDRDTPGVSDELRPLTEEGISKFKKTAKALSLAITPDAVLSSPYLRAKQTAEIVARQWAGVTVQECEPLADGSRAKFEEMVARVSEKATLAIVGHEPHLSDWIAAWLGAPTPDAFAFKKGGAALVEFDGEVCRGGARLVWFASPRFLKDLTES